MPKGKQQEPGPDFVEVEIDNRYRLVLPPKLRNSLGLQPGGKITFIVINHEHALVTTPVTARRILKTMVDRLLRIGSV